MLLKGIFFLPTFAKPLVIEGRQIVGFFVYYCRVFTCWCYTTKVFVSYLNEKHEDKTWIQTIKHETLTQERSGTFGMLMSVKAFGNDLY